VNPLVAFPVHELIVADQATLRRALPIDPGGVRSRRLFKSDDVAVVGVAMDAGAVMQDHSAQAPILIQVLEGRGAVQVRGTRIELPAGGLLHVESGLRHGVEALEPMRFLLLLLLGAGGVSARRP
jgi:quercetin dioxygenase-like cupin family protein